MKPRTALILLLLVALGGYWSGDANGSARRDAEHAVAVAKVQQAYADSIRRLVVQQDDEKRRAVDSVKRETSTRIQAAERGTNRALALAATARQQAADALNAPVPDTGAMRVALVNTSTALGAVTDSLLNERAVHQTALRQRDSTHEARVGALRKGFDDTRAADSTAYASFKVGVDRRIESEYRRGVTRGRVEGALAVVATVLAIRR